MTQQVLCEAFYVMPEGACRGSISMSCPNVPVGHPVFFWDSRQKIAGMTWGAEGSRVVLEQGFFLLSVIPVVDDL